MHALPPAAVRRFVPGSSVGHWLATLCLLFVAWWSQPAQAQGCWSTGSTGVSFGTSSPTLPTDAQGTANLTCQANANPGYLRYCLYVAEGSPIAGFAPRWLTNYNGGQMAYNLYSDAARSQLLGPPPAGGGYPVATGTVAVPGSHAQASTNVPVYGRVPAGQDLPAGYYQSQINNSQFVWAMNTASYPSSCTSGTYTGTVGFYMGVDATVPNSCRISMATDLNFGTAYNLSANRDQTSAVSVRCPNGTSWTLGLNNGAHPSGTTRRLHNAGQHVTYELYKNAGRTQRWGNAGAELVSGTGAGDSNPVTSTVYGRVPAQGAAPMGNYSDTVVITLTY